ncbi:MAG: glycosyltransferase [Desulfovibrionaceae bacterium]|jgi:hypothetical protein|nr:glycosyltransferase [Desulfovibrionaceae bacterium]
MRPQRIRIVNELGKPRTLMSGAGQYERLGGAPGSPVLLLGLGPVPLDAVIAAGLSFSGAPVKYVECPDFERQMGGLWPAAVRMAEKTAVEAFAHAADGPAWERLAPEALTRELVRSCEVFRYRPAAQLFPSFWGPLVAACQWAFLAPDAPMERSRAVLVTADLSDLLAREIVSALHELGLKPKRLSPDLMAKDLPVALTRSRPQCCVSVNFKGLDAHGERYGLLRAAGVPVAVWCVDNPWHLLSGLKSPFWKDCHLFVTDASFIGPLKGHGARRVHHLPLAVDPAIFGPGPSAPPGSGSAPRDFTPLPREAMGLGQLTFVGRSAFPDRERYFAGCGVDPTELDAAREILARGGRPDHAWWVRRLGMSLLWPTAEARRPGFGAEESSRLRRAECLRAAARELTVTIFGDEGWRELAPEIFDLRSPVDYYGPLAAIYRAAPYTLNVTSLLLPHGLTQRHFDVWAAGGFLITDATPGLDIFPRELTEPVRFRAPSEIGPLVRRLESERGLTNDLRRAWRSLILSEHTYVHRMTTLLVALGL